MPLHGGKPEGRRIGKVYGLVGLLPSHSRSSPLSISLRSSPFPSFFPFTRPARVSPRARVLFPSPSSAPVFFLYLYLSLPEPVAHKLIRSQCLLARDSHWPPQSRRSLCSLCRSLLPPARSRVLSIHPTGPRPPFFSADPQIFAKVT